MTKEEAKELLHIIQAFVEGKTIQQRTLVGYEDEWIDTNLSSLIISPSAYHIKPESEYKPFKSKEECYQEMLKHKPFGWINIIQTGTIANILMINDKGIKLDGNCKLLYQEVFNNYQFADGTPFGIKEE